jgi:hypothetical protein
LASVPLSNDQKALLRLLAQREEGYEDIAALMGLSVGEVRARVRGALKELEGAGGSAAPSRLSGRDLGEAAAISEPPSSPAPEPPPRPTAAAPSPSKRPAPKRSRQPVLARSRRRLAELAGGALVVLLLVLFATGAIDIGDGDADSDSADTATAPAETVGAAGGKLTQAVLEPVEGGEASGRALFGRLGKEVVLQVIADGLEPTASGESYTVWLYRSPKLSLRIGAVRVNESGKLGARFAIPTEVLALVANGAFEQIDVSRTSDSAYRAEVARAKREQRLPRYTGESVLRGDIVGPLAEAGATGN